MPIAGFGVGSWFDHTSPASSGAGLVDNSSTMTRYDGTTGWSYNGHAGLDYPTGQQTGYNVIASGSGVVQFVGWQNPNPSVGFGFYVRVWHSASNSSTLYGHLSPTSVVSNGQNVSRGQLLGYSGNTGQSTGPHLHFGVYNSQSGWIPMDPYGWSGGGSDPWGYDIGYLWTTNPPSMQSPGKQTDFNGDGKSDAITFNTSGQGVVSLSNGSSFGGAVSWGVVSTWGEIPDTGDFNGDGKDDAITFNPSGQGVVSLSTGSGFVWAGPWGIVTTWGEIPDTGDFNGDGKDDAITFNPSGQGVVSLSTGASFVWAGPWGIVTTWGEVPGVGDFNGDGKDDVITFNPSGQGVVSLSTGSSFVWAGPWGIVSTWGEIPEVGDFNGDGKDDAITFNPSGQGVVSLSTGAGFVGAVPWGYVFWWGEIPGVGDFNGDGKDDTIWFSAPHNGFVSLSTGSSFVSVNYWGYIFTWGEIPGGFQPVGYEKLFDRWFGLW